LTSVSFIASSLGIFLQSDDRMVKKSRRQFDLISSVRILQIKTTWLIWSSTEIIGH